MVLARTDRDNSRIEEANHFPTWEFEFITEDMRRIAMVFNSNSDHTIFKPNIVSEESIIESKQQSSAREDG